MEPNNLSSNTIITIHTSGDILQTTFDTIKQNDKLMELLDQSKKTINVDIDHQSMVSVLNYLRGYKIDLIKEAPEAARKLDMIQDGSNEIRINIGGKIKFLSKEYLCSKFEYFELLFKYNSQLDPDYSNILIDRCYIMFDKMMTSIEKNRRVSDDIYDEFLFYGYRDKIHKGIIFEVSAFTLFVSDLIKM